MSNDKSLIIKKEVSAFTKTQVVIKNARDMGVAVDALSRLNKYLDSVTEEKEKVTKPLNEALKAERARWKPIELQLENAINDIRAKMIAYQTQERRKEEEEQRKIAERVSKGTLNIETAVKKMSELEKVEDTVDTDNGKVKFRTVKRFEVVNIKKVPTDYLIVNVTLIREAMKEGKEIQGVRYYDEQVPINFR